jgi:hypothetical protein
MSDKDLEVWVGDELIRLLGQQDKTTVRYVIALASQVYFICFYNKCLYIKTYIKGIFS